jgi:uncharacterized MAPEG superfamily protein
MALAYWCILVAALLPYVWVTLAKRGGPHRYDNHDPRQWQTRQDNPRSQRAYAAHLNAFEAFAPFAAAVLMAQAAGVAPARIGQLAVAFVVLRVLHGLFYVLDKPPLRSGTWALGYVVVLWLMATAALRMA